MKHIHFVIYRLKSIIIIYCSIYVISIYLEIEFIKLLDDVKIQRKTITFTKDECNRTVFINKMINSRIMRMFIFIYNFLNYIFYFISQVLSICTDDRGWFGMRNIFLFYFSNFFFLFNNLMRRNRHCI
jgi:hypothetical protein